MPNAINSDNTRNELNASLRLPSPNYTNEEKEKILHYFKKLNKDDIHIFLSQHNLDTNGNKTQLTNTIETAINNGQIQYEDLINHLDFLVPSSKQHVFLYNGPSEDILQNWRNQDYVIEVLTNSGYISFINKRLPLILPENLQISSILYKPNDSLIIYAVEKREYKFHVSELDCIKDKGEKKIEYIAYQKEIDRGVIFFKWNLISNTATLHITQLPKKNKYEKAEQRFIDLIKEILNLEKFHKLDISKSINKLHEFEITGKRVARPHGLNYDTPGGRKFVIKSPARKLSVMGEVVFDNSIKNLQKTGIGRLGNFYWLPSQDSSNIIEDEIHIIINARAGRINFPKPTSMETINYVISRVRTYSK